MTRQFKDLATYIKPAMSAINNAHANANLNYFGIRGDNYLPTIGQKLDPSNDWDYDNDCPSLAKLPGTCATGMGYLWHDGEEEDLEELAKAIQYHTDNYCCNHLSIIGGMSYECGADENEIVIQNAEVIYVF